MSTGCIAALGQCSTTLTVTLPANCTQVPQLGGSPTVLMFAGYQVPTRYYHSLAESLAANGYAVIQVTADLMSDLVCKPIASAVTNHSKMLQAMTGAKLSCSSMDTSAAAATQLG
jgi:hypothetical protein